MSIKKAIEEKAFYSYLIDSGGYKTKVYTIQVSDAIEIMEKVNEETKLKYQSKNYPEYWNNLEKQNKELREIISEMYNNHGTTYYPKELERRILTKLKES